MDIDELVTHYRSVLLEPQLLETAIFFNPSWDNSDRYEVAIPIGQCRRTGQAIAADAKTVDALTVRMATRPNDFPNPRFALEEDGLYVVRWGDDISHLWGQGPRGVEQHRQIGRAFGYGEEQIVKMYPDDWVAVELNEENTLRKSAGT
jgi:hypothetical protein